MTAVNVPSNPAPSMEASRTTDRGSGSALCLVAASASFGVGVAGLAVAFRNGAGSPVLLVGVMLVALWSMAGAALGVLRERDRLGPIVLSGAALGALWCLSHALTSRPSVGDGAETASRLCAALLPAVALHLLCALPDGRLPSPSRRRTVTLGYATAGTVGASMSTLDEFESWPVIVLWFVAIVVGGNLAFRRYRSCGAVDRRRIQWMVWGVAVATEAVLVVIALHLLTGWPSSLATVALALTGFVPFGVAAGTVHHLVARVDRLITRTVELAGLTALVIAVYVVVVLGLGRTPDGDERTLLLLSMAAAGLAALLYGPTRTWLTERTNRAVYGSRVAPDETLRTFGRRLTRSIPLDELMLQLTENLRTSMRLASAEVWTGQDGRYERVAGVPHRRPPPIEIGSKELPVIARAGVSGGTWIDIWLPALADPTGTTTTTTRVRVAPVAHTGLLLGFIVVARNPDDDAFTETEDTVLTELARQVGLALHNVHLDTALQASLDELRVRNDELQSSRSRIVSAGDAERRKLERNLHDGAQQHLVALAVKLRLAQDAIEAEPADAIAMIDEIKGDVQTAIAELRALAHGIFPPLLVSGGLIDALPAAAARAVLPTTVEFEQVGRYDNDVESAVYFCVLESLQNASKHAGAGAHVGVRVVDLSDGLRFTVVDDGAGFDPALVDISDQAHGFVNMIDRLGAIGGTIVVASTEGVGTAITGTIPFARAGDGDRDTGDTGDPAGPEQTGPTP